MDIGVSSVSLYALLREFRQPLFASLGSGGVELALEAQALPRVSVRLPPLYPEWLGDPSFNAAHGTRFPYVGGAMARGIASTDLVVALGRLGILGFFGAAGLAPGEVQRALGRIRQELGGDGLYGSNLIHTPGDPALEERLVDLYLEGGVRRVSAAAFMGITPALVRYALTGLSRAADGSIRRGNHLFAKVSRLEVARQFLAPAPSAMVAALRSRGAVSAEAAEWAARIPLCADLDVEADSGGHTDGRPLGPLFASMIRLREEMAGHYPAGTAIRLGAGGGLGTPEAVAAAFALGASHVVVGSVHQTSLEAGTSRRAKALLARAGVADFMTTPSADMFELGARVQVLKKGTLMGVRGNQLLDLYRRWDGLEALPAAVRADLEAKVFLAPLEAVWAETEAYFNLHDPAQLERAGRDPKHRMALLFRWYLGSSSLWPVRGDPDRVLDYQIWSGPAVGAFNDWVRGSFLEDPDGRGVAQIALNLLEGAAFATRSQQLRSLGLLPPGPAPTYRPEFLAL